MTSVLPAFDGHDPPEQALLDDCVHCGFCLPSCPTYVLWGQEMDSPRGRISLMREALEGEPLTDAMADHFDRCLGCMACVTACPSGVRYERLIEATRQQVERRHPRSLTDRAFRRAVFALFPHPARLRTLAPLLRAYRRLGIRGLLRRAGLTDRLPPRLRAMEALLPEIPAARELPGRIPARGTARRTVGLLAGCAQRVLLPGVNDATVRVLSAEGCEVVVPGGQGCCGALSLHAGREEEALAFARRTVDAFDAAGVEAVVVNAAGCGSAMKQYGALLAGDAAYAERGARLAERVRDVTEVLAGLEPIAPRHPLPLAAAYHDACHLAHAQGVRREPRDLLRRIPGLELREIAESDLCCGSAGVYNLLEPEPAAELGERKARHVLDSGAEVLVTANPGCILQIRAALERLGRPLPVVHPVEVVDASIRGRPPSSLLGLAASARDPV